LNDKSDCQETNELRISIQTIKENMKLYCLVNDFKKKTVEIDENIKGVKEIKANKDMINESVKELDKKIVNRANELEE